jgi:pimeloyl-ACP methyl ester carboxylesterase
MEVVGDTLSGDRVTVLRVGLTFGVLLVLGCANGYGQPAPTETGIVFRVDGSSPIRGMGDDLRQAVADAKAPLKVVNFAWSHGPIQILADLHEHDYQNTKGRELAAAIVAYRKNSPTGKVYLVSHSSGAAVVLAAAANLPAGSVERIVLLAPALAPTCDLGPALRCARAGVDSFHSAKDIVGLCLAVMGNADGEFQVSAGSAGFTVPRDGAVENPLYAKLHQHAWDLEMCKTGHLGGHFGCTRAGFLRTYVVPLLTGNLP